MGFPAARLTDMHLCPMVTGIVPHVGGPILGPGCPTVLIQGLAAARVTDLLTCVGPPDIIIKGSSGVFIGGLPAARMLDNCAHGGVILLGCITVLIGETGSKGGADGGGGAGGAAGGPASSCRVGEAPAGSTNGPFANADQAARAALNVANPQSVAANCEYGGMIYRDMHGQYWFTGPGSGTDQGFNPSTTPIPPGTHPAGDYHCHGDYSTVDRATRRAVRTSDPCTMTSTVTISRRRIAAALHTMRRDIPATKATSVHRVDTLSRTTRRRERRRYCHEARTVGTDNSPN